MKSIRSFCKCGIENGSARMLLNLAVTLVKVLYNNEHIHSIIDENMTVEKKSFQACVCVCDDRE
jgi:hypothetical protein